MLAFLFAIFCISGVNLHSYQMLLALRLVSFASRTGRSFLSHRAAFKIRKQSKLTFPIFLPAYFHCGVKLMAKPTKSSPRAQHRPDVLLILLGKQYS